MKRFLLPRLMFILGLVLGLAGAAQALTYEIYTNEADFLAAAGPTRVHDFESDALGLDYKVHDFGDFAVNGSRLYSVTVREYASRELWFNTSSYAQNLDLTFAEPVTAVGFNWWNRDNNSDMVRVVFDNVLHLLGAKDETGFWGVVATSGLITPEMAFGFGDTAGGAGWSAGTIDNIRYSGGDATAAPVPGALVLLGSGLVGLVGMRRRN